MGLEKAIASGQEHRKPYHGAMTVCFNCRNHGTCDYCRGNRLYGARKREAAADERQDEYEAYVCSGEVSTADAFYEDRLRAKHKPVIRGVVQITGPSAFVGCAGQARERKVLTACLRGISKVCLCQIPFQQESAEIGKCVDVIVEADIAAGELDAAVNVVILLTGTQCTGGFCRAVFRLDLNRSHKK